jgi:hypothetical protein
MVAPQASVRWRVAAAVGGEVSDMVGVVLE